MLINKFLIFVFLIFNIIFAFKYFNQGTVTKEYQGLKTIHFSAKRAISTNLQTSCTILKDSTASRRLKESLEQQGLKFHLVRKKAVSINDLNFFKVVFKTYLAKSESIQFVSEGYLVQNSITDSCYGLI